ncbi:thioesterase domain-containing protein [Peteryoungia desertarenae]|nr:thioesterase domain-containing protein [Peteryoungia desertarenae]
MKDLLQEIFEGALRKPLDPEADLLEQGLNAHRFIGVMREFWLRTGVEFDVNLPYEHRSIRTLAEAMSDGNVLPKSKLIMLKAGAPDKPLFVCAGGASCFLEMQDLFSGMDLPDAIVGISLTRFERSPPDAPTVADEVKTAIAAIRSRQSKGPYRLLGYSFGGICALELARTLVAEGECVEFLAMLDTPLSDHNNEFRQWLTLMSRIIGRQIGSRLRHLRSKRPAVQE